ncbi:MAG: DEAD/DEAH box helicase [Candidatus Magasanikbacteria bacterium]|nr:DEAD/DEAH box helicase [Candidatus Magasanikbacteria bacterium]
MTDITNAEQASFNGLGIAPALMQILDRAKFTVPTPIQIQAIPIAVTGKDIVGIAQTGTGKTLAFTIPILQRLQQVRGRALIVAPTRELAVQIEETIQQIGRTMNIRSVVLMGGSSMHMQIQKLRQNPRVIVATPGRLLDHMQQRTISIKDVEIIVLDEADRMFDMGFMPAINKIFAALPPQRQTMLFSATMPPDIMKLAAKYMELPVRVEVVQQGTTADRVVQELVFVRKDDKHKLLEKILGEITGSVLVFSRTKHGANRMTRMLRDAGFPAAEIHSDRSLSQRREALEGFKRGKYRVLVATDIAARGIDVKGIELVLNFDLPDSSEDYVHRIGRTGRAGQKGRAISFATPDQKQDVRSIERLIRMPLPITHVPELSVAVSGGYEGGSGNGGGGRRPYQARGNNPRQQSYGDRRNSAPQARPAYRNDRGGATEQQPQAAAPQYTPGPRAPGPSFARRGRGTGFKMSGGPSRQKRTIM